MADTIEANAARGVREGSTDDRTLVIERVFKAPPEQVFRRGPTRRSCSGWGPEGHHAPECAMDVREGGAWRTVMQNQSGGTHTVSGVYREITPPKRLVMTWAWQQPDGSRGHETMVELSFEPTPGGTRLRLVQRVFANVEQRDNHRMGWSSSLDKLDALVARSV